MATVDMFGRVLKTISGELKQRDRTQFIVNTESGAALLNRLNDVLTDIENAATPIPPRAKRPDAR